MAFEPVARTCGNCGHPRASKRYSFQELPNRLVLQLKRFSSTGVKDDRRIPFPSRLDMTDFTSHAADGREDHGAGRFDYDLYAILVHAGTSIARGKWSTYRNN